MGARVRLLPLTIAVIGISFFSRVAHLAIGPDEGDIIAAPAMAQHADEKPADAGAPLKLTPGEPRQVAEAAGDESHGVPAGKAEVKVQDYNAPPDSYASPLIDADREYSDSELELLQKLSERRAALDAREKEMNTQSALLQATEKKLDAKMAELDKIKGEIENLLKVKDEQEEAKIDGLVKIYETMKPKDAARIFDSLEMEVLLQVVSRMKSKATAPILAAMQADRARAITVLLSERPDRVEFGAAQ